MINLRDYQARAVDDLRALMRTKRRVVLCMPTGAGKTHVAMFLIHSGLAKRSRVYFVCDRQTLVHQTSMRFTEHGIPHGVLMNKTDSKHLHENILVVSAQTLESRGFDFQLPGDVFKRGGRAPDPDFVIIDECHEQRKALLKHVKERDIRLVGMSATPLAAGLTRWYQGVANCTTTSELMRQGHLVPLEVVAPVGGLVDTNGVPVGSNREWKASALSERVLQVTSGIVPTWERETERWFGGPVKTIGFFPSVADVLDACERFRAAGYTFEAITHKSGGERQQELVRQFREGKIIGLLTCAVLTKGFDVPETMCMIDAAPLRRSLQTHIQRLGRVLRTAPDKQHALLIDHADNYSAFQPAMHAFFDLGCQGLSERNAKGAHPLADVERKALKCRACGYVFPRVERGTAPLTECPSCGAAIKRKRGVIEWRHGDMGHVETVDGKGRKLPWEGDWWPEICALTSNQRDWKTKRPISDEDAKRRAFAKFKSVFGVYPRRQFERVNRQPVPEVKRYFARAHAKWKRTQAKTKPKPRQPRPVHEWVAEQEKLPWP